MSTHSTECSKVAEPSGRTSLTRQTFTEMLVVSAVCVVPETVVRTRQRCTTFQRSVSPGWNL